MISVFRAIDHWQCHISYEAREAQASWPLQSRAPNIKAGIQCSFSLPTRYDYCPTFNAICQGWPASQRPRATFLTVTTFLRATFPMVTAKSTSYTRAHMNITPSLPLSNTYLCSARLIVNITHQWQNFTSHLLLYMLFSGTSGSYVSATWNRTKSRIGLASRGLVTPTIYRLCVQQEKTLQALVTSLAEWYGTFMGAIWWGTRGYNTQNRAMRCLNTNKLPLTKLLLCIKCEKFTN